MLKSEFIERTGYTPTAEEYHYIEESYYEFDGNKDEFCKQWMKDKRSGKWAMELRFRMQLDAQKAEYEAKIAEQQETIEFYNDLVPKLRQHEKELTKTVIAQNEKLEALKRRTERLAAVFDS